MLAIGKVVPAVIAAVLVGGGVAAAAEVSPSPDPVGPPSVTSTTSAGSSSEAADSPETGGSPTSAESSEAAETPETEAPEADGTSSPPAAAPATTACPDGLRNHGEYVSSVARSGDTTGAEHGAAVSAAAHSDCGKAAKDDADEAPDGTASPDATERSDSTRSPAPAKVSGKRQRHDSGKSRGQGRHSG